MTKVQSGLILLAVAVGLNLLGRGVAFLLSRSASAAGAGFVALLMFVSVVVGLFGLFRLIVGAFRR